jgi:hypothetical protein
MAWHLRYCARIPIAIFWHTHYNRFWKGQTVILSSYLPHNVILLLLRAVV